MQKTRPDLYASDYAMAQAIEMFDHGLKQPCAALSAITGKEARLSATGLSRLPRASAYKTMLESDNVSVMQEFQGDYPGAFLLLVDAHRCSQVISGSSSDLSPIDAISEVDGDTLCELGNIVLNGMLRTVSILIGSRLNCTHPRRPSIECMKQNFSDTGVYQSDVSIIDIEYCWQENGVDFSAPLSMQLHLGSNAHLQAWEDQAYHSFDAEQE
jgi:chemotaxis protein CheY-P-specific phosphatase CheC